MRGDKIILYLKSNPYPSSLTELANNFRVSKRTISNDLKSLNSLGATFGFQIVNLRSQGYKLDITDENRFRKYFHQIVRDQGELIMNPESRKINIKLLLLLSNNYVTLSQMAETLDVSPSTIKNDLIEVKKDFSNMELVLTSKAHYGYKITGPEENRRLLIIQLLRNDIAQPIFTKEYQDFTASFDTKKLKAFLIKNVNNLNIKVNDLVMKNLVQHIFLLVFRIKQHNCLKETHETFYVQDDFTQLTENIAHYIYENEKIRLSDGEKIYLSRQLFGKIVTLNDSKQRQKLTAIIYNVLQKIDKKYQTFFHQDQELTHALALHVAPLLQRLYIDRQLDNPIIDDIYTRYANVFNISFDFIDEISKDGKLVISKDEAGYLAIYFAASLEKQVKNIKDQYHKIAVICATGGGASFFIKTKLEQIFINANVDTFSLVESGKIDYSYDLIITTVPTQNDFNGIPIIQTHAILTDNEIHKIQQDLLLIHENKGVEINIDQQLLALFSETNFQITNEKDYLQILKKQGEYLEEKGWASPGYASLVLEREQLVDTIYDQGIAGPHPMESKTIKECIRIILCPEESMFHNKRVRLIFLINISNNHLFLHKEISRLMMKMMADPDLMLHLTNMKSFNEFFFYIKELIKRR